MRQSRYYGHVAKADDFESKALRQAGLPLRGGGGRLHLSCWRAAHLLIHDPRTWIGAAPLSDQRLPELRSNIAVPPPRSDGSHDGNMSTFSKPFSAGSTSIRRRCANGAKRSSIPSAPSRPEWEQHTS